MADYQGFEAGAGEGNRTLVVSLGSLCLAWKTTVFRASGIGNTANMSRTNRLISASLPQSYRAPDLLTEMEQQGKATSGGTGSAEWGYRA